MMQPLFNTEAMANVSYIGSVEYNKIKDYINSASICVFPTFAEALPVSWIEAMAMKKPIVASNIGWATEIIDNEVNGFLENPKNHIEFAKVGKTHSVAVAIFCFISEYGTLPR